MIRVLSNYRYPLLIAIANIFRVMKVIFVLTCPFMTHFLFGGWIWTLFGVVLGCALGIISKRISVYFYRKCSKYYYNFEQGDIWRDNIVYFAIGLPALLGCIDLGIYKGLIWIGAGQSLIYIVMLPIAVFSALISFMSIIE